MKKRNILLHLRQIIALFCIGVLLVSAFYPFSLKNEVNAQTVYLSQKSFSLSKRYPDPYVNDVMKKNILLTLAYQRGLVHPGETIDWNLVEKPFETSIYLPPNSLFSFHEDVTDKYKGLAPFTLKSHFNSDEGFISDGYLVGDGVCHLASLIYWASKDAGLEVTAPTNHDFAHIEEIPKEYGVSIFYDPGNYDLSARQNLYVVNNHGVAIKLVFKYDGEKVSVSVMV